MHGLDADEVQLRRDEIHGALYVNLARGGDLSIRIQVTPQTAEDPEEHAAGLERDRAALLRLAEVAAQAAREIGPESPEDDVAEDTRRLAEIRALLAAFDWEHDDRQYALERIEMIVADYDDQADEPEDDYWRDYNYTCSTCGGQISMFIGHQGWQHYRGSGTTADRIEIYDAGHEATFADGGQP